MDDLRSQYSSLTGARVTCQELEQEHKTWNVPAAGMTTYLRTRSVIWSFLSSSTMDTSCVFQPGTMTLNDNKLVRNDFKLVPTSEMTTKLTVYSRQ